MLGFHMCCYLACEDFFPTYTSACPGPQVIRLITLLFGTLFTVILEYWLGNSEIVENVKNVSFYEPSCIVGGAADWSSCIENSIEAPQKK